MLYGGMEGYMVLYGACGFIGVLLLFIFIIKVRGKRK